MDNSSEDIFTEIRMKYAEDLEEILECPVCFELPDGPIAQCVQGHHICASCKDLLINTGHKCPMCESSFGSSRNYAAEKLCAKFEDIKNSILNPNHASNRRINKKSVEIQTDFECQCIADEESCRRLDTSTKMFISVSDSVLHGHLNQEEEVLDSEMIIQSKQKIPKIESSNSINDQNKRTIVDKKNLI